MDKAAFNDALETLINNAESVTDETGATLLQFSAILLVAKTLHEVGCEIESTRDAINVRSFLR